MKRRDPNEAWRQEAKRFKSHVSRVERAEAIKLLSRYARERKTITPAQAESLYGKLERVKRQLEQHHGTIGETDERTVKLERRITHALSTLGPIMRRASRDMSSRTCTTWRLDEKGRWYHPSFGLISKRPDGWYGFAPGATRVGPYPTAKDARYALGHKVIGSGGRQDVHRHRNPNAPTFKKQAWISKKIRLLREEGYAPKQAEAIAYRMAGVPKRDPAEPSVRRGTILINSSSEEIFVGQTHKDPGRPSQVELINRDRQTRSFMTEEELSWMMKTKNFKIRAARDRRKMR